MRIAIPAALAACLFALAACTSDTTVRGTRGRSVTATTPTEMTIHRGQTATLQVGIDRERFSGPVTVSIFQLPQGVETDTTSIVAETTSATFILRASAGASLVTNQAVGVTVADPNGRTATQFVNLDVVN